MRIHWVLALCAVGLGCATTGPPPAALDPVAFEPAPVPETNCDQVDALRAAGEHKPAVDQADQLARLGLTCASPVLHGVEASRALLGEADAHVHRGLEEKEEGDLVSAAESFRQALAIYPQYYWVEKLLRGVAVVPESEPVSPVELADWVNERIAAGDLAAAIQSIESTAPDDHEWMRRAGQLREDLAQRYFADAREAERRGDLDAAATSIRAALRAGPSGADLREEVVEFVRLLGLRLFSAGELTRAKNLWHEGLSLDSGNAQLREYVLEVEERLRSLRNIRTGDGGS